MILSWVAFIGLLIFSVVIHEVAHGVVANHFGDPTAKRLGRITLNPLVHLDWLGSVILPLVLLVTHSPVWFAWAKPVPVNTRYFRRPDSDMMWVAFAGPLSNITLAVVVSIILRIFSGWGGGFPDWVTTLALQFVLLNISLAVFNLIPIPPLDGSRILYRFLSSSWRHYFYKLEPYGIGILLALSFFNILSPLVNGINRVIYPWITYGI